MTKRRDAKLTTFMISLSVNVNKIATIRNSRGGDMPRVTDAVAVCLAAGVPGITVHPRADQRHITPDDVRDVAAQLAKHTPHIEFNIEGDPRPDLVALVDAAWQEAVDDTAAGVLITAAPSPLVPSEKSEPLEPVSQAGSLGAGIRSGRTRDDFKLVLDAATLRAVAAAGA